jgi:hypothetical protein
VRRIGLLLCLSVIVSVSGCRLAGRPKELEYAAVLLDGKKIGYVIHTRKVEGNKVRTSDEMNLSISRASVTLKISTTETSIETLKGKPLGFETLQNITGMKQTAVGTINADGKVEVTITSMGIPQKKVIDWPEGAVMAEGLRLMELDKKLIKGSTYTAKVFTPSLLSAIDARVEVGGKANVDLFGRIVPLTEIKVVMKMQGTDIATTSFVDDDLNALKTIMPLMGMNLEVIACEKEFAISEDDVVDFLDRMFVQCPQALKDISQDSGLVYTLAAKTDTTLKIPADDTQTVKELADGKIQLTVKPVKAAVKVKFPYNGKDEQLLEALKPSTYLQSDQEVIHDLAKEAVGNEKDAAAAAKKIEAFVNKYITQKDLSIGYATAGEVAAGKQGDCTEHAVLTAAMCRAAGIPARVAVGLVYVDSFADREHVFGGHAWTQANIGGKWINLDATRVPRENPAGYILLGMGNGDPQDFFGMVNTLGCFTIESVEAAK